MQTIHFFAPGEECTDCGYDLSMGLQGWGCGQKTPLFSRFFWYILDETPKEYTAAYDFDKRFVIFFFARFAVLHH